VKKLEKIEKAVIEAEETGWSMPNLTTKDIRWLLNRYKKALDLVELFEVWLDEEAGAGCNMAHMDRERVQKFLKGVR